MLSQTRVYFSVSLAAIVSCIGLIVMLDTTPTSAFMQTTPEATAVVDSQTDQVERGRYLVTVAGCVGCHGTPALATDQGMPLAGGNRFPLGGLGVYHAPNITNLQGMTVEDFDRPMRQGLDPYTDRVLVPIKPYAAYHKMSDSDLAAILAYLQTLEPVTNPVRIPDPEPGPGAANLKPIPPESIPDPTINDSAEYGNYLVNAIANCGSCHSPMGNPGKAFAGGTRNIGTPEMPVFAPSITGASLVAQGYTQENFIATLRLGIVPRGVRLAPQMPWRRYAGMTDSDLIAVWNYLQTVEIAEPWPVQTMPPPPPTQPVPTMEATAAATP